MLEGWGSRESVITRSDGVPVHREGKNYFERFSHRGVDGRTGRGDTLFRAYLARRMDHPVDDSLRFAAALTSIKMETPGPFTGTLEDVLARSSAAWLFSSFSSPPQEDWPQGSTASSMYFPSPLSSPSASTR